MTCDPVKERELGHTDKPALPLSYVSAPPFLRLPSLKKKTARLAHERLWVWSAAGEQRGKRRRGGRSGGREISNLGRPLGKSTLELESPHCTHIATSD